jgi:hypothetical protein
MVRTRNYVANDDQKKQGCQERRPPPVGDATSERSPDTHKVRPQHTQAARNNRTPQEGRKEVTERPRKGAIKNIRKVINPMQTASDRI